MSVENWQKFARWAAGKSIIRYCRAEFLYDDKIGGLDSPFLIIANHTTVTDPFLLSIGLNRTVYYVTSDLYFRKPLLRFLAKKVGCIPKAKGVSDFHLIKTLTEHVRKGHCIGIYPEGYRIWDGETDFIPQSTAKLIKLLKIPVVAVVTSGGYLSMPRWARHNRKGKIMLHYRIILTEKEINEKNANEIYEIVCRALFHSEYGAQRRDMTEYRGRKLAEALELLLYCCPHCRRFETMTSSAGRFYCRACGYGVKINEYGFFEGDKIYYDNVRDWRKFCDEELSRQISNKPISAVFSKRKAVLLRDRKRRKAFVVDAQGMVELTDQAFVFRSFDKTKTFCFEQIKGLTVSKKNVIDFYYDMEKFRIRPKSKMQSAVFWERGFRLLSDQQARIDE